MTSKKKPTDEELLASLGYKQEFKREFTPLEVFGVAFSIIGLVPSIASVLFYAIAFGGGPAMVWGYIKVFNLIRLIFHKWAVASVFILTVGILYFWTYSLSSPKWKGLLCWVVGYAYAVGSISAFSSIDWGCAVQIMAAATIGSGGTFQPTSAQTYAVFTMVIFAHIGICSLGTAILARLQRVYVVLNLLLCLAIIIALPVATPAEFRNTVDFALKDLKNLSEWPDGYAFILSLNTPLWTICSFASSVNISEEASNAATAVPWGMTLAVAIAGIVGLAVNISLAFCMGTDLEALNNSNQPMAQIFFQSFGERGTLIIWAVIVITQYAHSTLQKIDLKICRFMMGSSMLLAASRQIFAFSRDSGLPFSSWLYRLNKFTKTPVNAVVFDGVVALFMGCLVFAGDQAINAIFALSIVGNYVAYSIPIAARFLGQNDFKPGPFNLGKFSFPVTTIAVIFMVFMSIVFFFPMSPTTDAQGMNYTVVVLGGTMLLSIIYFYFPKYGGVNCTRHSEEDRKDDATAVDVIDAC
ncbi:hypothetical protein J132_08762 [Termitomyces sp. J132]|nr:hypothetical protein J132_08762 [Termitomyces sp. J132]